MNEVDLWTVLLAFAPLLLAAVAVGWTPGLRALQGRQRRDAVAATGFALVGLAALLFGAPGKAIFAAGLAVGLGSGLALGLIVGSQEASQQRAPPETSPA